jgi:hypothetical protein
VKANIFVRRHWKKNLESNSKVTKAKDIFFLSVAPSKDYMMVGPKSQQLEVIKILKTRLDNCEDSARSCEYLNFLAHNMLLRKIKQPHKKV